MYQQTEIKKCEKCGDPVPEGKTLCWCCEHTPKLHRDIDYIKELLKKGT